jgi:hypothetical protein
MYCWHSVRDGPGPDTAELQTHLATAASGDVAGIEAGQEDLEGELRMSDSLAEDRHGRSDVGEIKSGGKNTRPSLPLPCSALEEALLQLQLDASRVDDAVDIIV